MENRRIENMPIKSLEGFYYCYYFYLLFLDKCNDFANKNEEFYNPTVKNLLTVVNGMTHQIFVAGMQARYIYPQLIK